MAFATWDRSHPQSDRDLAIIRDALGSVGVDAEPVAWTKEDDLSRFDACVLHSAWDSAQKLDAFRAWVEKVEAATPLWNPGRHVAWNLHKGYLLDLAGRHGVPIPPTRLLGRGVKADLASLMEEEGWSRAVVKPAVGATSVGLFAADAHDGQPGLDALLAAGDVVVQQFLPSVPSRGEVSIFAFDGALARAVRKRPAPGDFRVQAEYGGTHAPATAERDESALARRVLDALPEPLLYARVDIVRLPDGSPALMELEAIDPYLFFRTREDAQPYVDAIVRRLKR